MNDGISAWEERKSAANQWQSRLWGRLGWWCLTL